MTRICLVKQHTTYDLYTETGPDLRAIVASSNFRSGPIGLFEAFDCDFRVVWEDAAPECSEGKRHWESYVRGWQLWPPRLVPEEADDIDWGQYDAVVAVDVALPGRIVRAYPQVLWCHYFIEGGPEALDLWARGSPRYGYNVFITQRLGKAGYGLGSRALAHLSRTRRGLLDAPYFLQSSTSVARLFGDPNRRREGVCLSLHSQDIVSPAEITRLEEFGPVRTPRGELETVLEALAESRYFVIHPRNKRTCGNALIEAISAGCLALAPSSSLWGYPEIVLPQLDYQDFDGLIAVIRAHGESSSLHEAHRAAQAALIDQWCYRNPVENLAAMLEVFRASPATVRTQARSERWSRTSATVAGTARHVSRVSRRISP
jgi:hypothetical protein